MNKLNNYTVIVNSSDGFEDCWNPFFTLFAKYWPNCDKTIILNTETKNYKHSELEIRSSIVGTKENGKRLTWSECLINALHQIETPSVLYLQEDYIIF